MSDNFGRLCVVAVGRHGTLARRTRMTARCVLAGVEKLAMRPSGAGIKAWTLMVAVAIVAVSLAAARAESAPSAAIAIVGGCISYLAYKRYTEAVSLRRASGLTTSPSRKMGMFLASVTVAAVVIGLSDIGFLTGYYGFMKIAYNIVVMSHWTPYDDAGFMATGGMIGVVLALCVASSLRRTVCSHQRTEPGQPRRWLKLWPVGLVMLIGASLVAEEMRERYAFCRMMAEYHAGPEAKADGLKKAALHAWLKRWYERAAIRPWLPVHPRHLPPGLK